MPNISWDLRDAAGIAQVGFGRLDPNQSLDNIANQYALAFEGAPNGFLLADESGRIRVLNAAVEKMFGYARDELIGKPVELILPPDLHAGLGLHKDGSHLPIQVRFHTLDTSTGKRTLYTFINVATELRYESQLEQAKLDAEDASRAKSDFLARMSHELRTPMNLIAGINELLLQSGLTEAQQHQVQVADRNIRRLLGLINGILELAKSEFTSEHSGSPTPPPEPLTHTLWHSDGDRRPKFHPAAGPFHPPRL